MVWGFVGSVGFGLVEGFAPVAGGVVVFDAEAGFVVFVEADDVDAGVVAFVPEFCFFVGCEGEAVVGVADGWSAPALLDADGDPLVVGEGWHGGPYLSPHICARVGLVALMPLRFCSAASCLLV